MIASCCGKSREFYFHNAMQQMMTGLQTASTLFKQTGGLHNAAISDGDEFSNIDKI